MSQMQKDKIRSDLKDPDIDVTDIEDTGSAVNIKIQASCSVTNLERLVQPDYEIYMQNSNADSGPYAAVLRPLL